MRYEKDEKRIFALEYLTKLGVLLPLDKIELASNSNVDFAPYKNGCYIFNLDYDIESLTDEQKDAVKSLFGDLSQFSVSELAPVTFEERYLYDLVYKELEEATRNSGYITQDMCLKVSEKLSSFNVQSQLVNHVAGGMNAKLMLSSNPFMAIQKFMALQKFASNTNEDLLVLRDENGDEYTVPFSRECITAWLYNNNIIAAKGKIDNTYNENTVIVFDKKMFGTKQDVENKRQAIKAEFGDITDCLSHFISDEDLKEFLKKASPEEVIEFAKQNPIYRDLLNGDAKNWEKYTVGEHTEAVLRNFEDAYADDVPEELYPFMKFMILVHDLGKSRCKTLNKDEQKRENAIACSQFCKDMGVDPKVEKLMQFIIGDSQNYTTQYYVMKNVGAKRMLYNACLSSLREALGEEPSENQVNGLASICKILQTCDSGAYTAYGVVRDSKTNVYYRGGNYAWTRGFKTPQDLRRKADMRFNEPEEKE